MTAAEEENMGRLAAARGGDGRLAQLKQGVAQRLEAAALASEGTTNATGRMVRRRIINWFVHGLVVIGAPESVGITLLVGAMFDLLLRLPLTVLGPLVGIKGGWADLLTIKFFDGDLLDKVDALMVFCEIMAALVFFTSLAAVVVIIYQAMTDNPAFVVFKNLI